MADWMEWATGWFADWRKKFASQPVLYIWPGVAEVEIKHATIDVLERSTDDMGIGVSSEQLGWILDPNQLIANQDIRFPTPGDIIQATFDGQVIDFEVSTQSETAPCWEWLDAHRKMIIVFCKSHQWPEHLQRR